MAEAVGLASGIAGLVTIAMKISKLSYDYMSTVKSAHETQKQYLREVTGLTDGGASATTAASRFTKIKISDYWYLPSSSWYGDALTVTTLHLAATAGVAETVRLMLQRNVDVDASTAAPIQNATQDGFYRVPTLGGGFTALQLALGTWIDLNWKRFMPSKEELEIFSMPVNRGASVEGTANHLRVEDIAKFEEFPELWDKLRAGITVKQ
ncbi:hypothetical protein QIS74_11570 [Colletotrichum tabaci]|uniref:Uncharacterized protein n=1 Tax=Colletotrichum tabaci TaxID=1209068 RepID=A0AAV9SYZ5_9PEZI